ncbi:TROVE domain-containing protein [Candidatus Neomarinimicrobiota bacterium]
MSKFNKVSSGTRTKNLAGGDAFKISDELQFATILLTSFVEAQFYSSENETIDKVANLITGFTDKQFAAKASVYARNEYGMRSITHVAAAEIAKEVKGVQWTAKYFDMVIRRVDDITEILSYYLNKHGKPIPNALKKGLRSSFDKFDEYQLAKYRAEGKAFSLIDAVNLLHPIPTDKNGDALKKLVKGELISKDTWEVGQTQAGQKANTEEEKKALKKENWVHLVKSKKLGYFALLRNLRNITAQAPEVLTEALDMLTDEKLISKSLVLPFRYYTAIRELEKASIDRKVISALSTALEKSVVNVPRFEGKTLIALDDSGSMTWGNNEQWGKPITIGSLFAAVLYKANPDSDFMKFSVDARYGTYNDMDATLTIQKQMMENLQGSGTNFHSIFTTANKKYDRVIILSDMQGWMGSGALASTFNTYKANYKADPHVYSWDLQGYGTVQFPERQVYMLAGFSEKVFDVMKLLETDKQALVNTIKAIKF